MNLLIEGILLVSLGVYIFVTIISNEKKILNFLEWAETHFKDQPEILKAIKKAIAQYFNVYTNGDEH